VSTREQTVCQSGSSKNSDAALLAGDRLDLGAFWLNAACVDRAANPIRQSASHLGQQILLRKDGEEDVPRLLNIAIALSLFDLGDGNSFHVRFGKRWPPSFFFDNFPALVRVFLQKVGAALTRAARRRE
jgi:hypothetical protein